VEPGRYDPSMNLGDIASRARCKACRQRGDVLALPAKRLPHERVRDSADPVTDLVAGFFHTMRSQGKRSKRGWQPRGNER
jgi:hypothetical protein